MKLKRRLWLCQVNYDKGRVRVMGEKFITPFREMLNKKNNINYRSQEGKVRSLYDCDVRIPLIWK